MHEDLLGYLLGALEPHEMRRVAQWLRDDPEAREQLAELERALKPLEGSVDPVVSPPVDLVSKTMANLPPNFADATAIEEQSSGPKPTQADDEPVLVAMRPEMDPLRSSVSSWKDWFVGAAAVAVILVLLVSSLAEGRFEARKIACQDQLRQFGTAITQFVYRSEQERLPAVAEAGPEAFAGVYTVRLKEAGLLDDPSIRWCPSLDRPNDSDAALVNVNEIASITDLHDASVDRLRQIQQYAGGQYAYTLGVIESDQLTSPRFESRASFAVMSDAPLGGVNQQADWSGRVGHSGTGINVLFEDGRVQFVAIPSLDSLLDHPLLNHRGKTEAGVNVDDASLAPSWRPPFVNVKQR